MSIEAMKQALEAMNAYMDAKNEKEDEKAHYLIAAAFLKIKEAIKKAEQQEKLKLLPRCFADYQQIHANDRSCEWCAVKTQCQTGENMIEAIKFGGCPFCGKQSCVAGQCQAIATEESSATQEPVATNLADVWKDIHTHPQPKLEDWGYGPHESHSSQPKAEQEPKRAPLWIDPNDKTQKQFLPHIGEPVLFCHKGKTYYGKHTGGSFRTGQGITAVDFITWSCHWMYLPAAHGIKGEA